MPTTSYATTGLAATIGKADRRRTTVERQALARSCGSGVPGRLAPRRLSCASWVPCRDRASVAGSDWLTRKSPLTHCIAPWSWGLDKTGLMHEC